MTETEALALMVAPGQPRPRKYRDGVIQIHVTRACDQACFNCTQGSNLAGKTTFMTPGQFERAVASMGFRAGDGRRPAFGWGNPEGRYPGVVGVFGGNPALSPHFEACCLLLREYVPFAQRGLWCNHPAGKGKVMAATFDPAVSNLNCHLDRGAYDEFKRDWPAARVVGLDKDSRHSPCYVAMKDVLRKECPHCGTLDYMPLDEGGGGLECSACDGTRAVYDEARAWELIAGCDINQNWSAMIGLFRGKLRAWFCEVAGAQAILHQDEPDYPDTGFDVGETLAYRNTATGETVVLAPADEPDPVTGRTVHRLPVAPTGQEWRRLEWWQLPMDCFAAQVRQHCHDCGVPLRGYGELSQAEHGNPLRPEPGKSLVAHNPCEQTSATHVRVFRPKRPGRGVEVVTRLEQLGVGRLARVTDYLGNAKR